MWDIPRKQKNFIIVLQKKKVGNMSNKNLNKAKKTKNDEFYTQLTDIEKELHNYWAQLKGKVILMPCDDPELIPNLASQNTPEKKASQFWVYFHKLFDAIKPKKIIATHYNPKGNAYKIEYSRGNDNDIMDFKKSYLKGDGDFRSDEIKAIIKESDVIITNPPFSLFREFVNQILVEQKKEILVIGNKNAFGYKEIFKLFKENKIWAGYNNVKHFVTHENKLKKFGNISWFTNLQVTKREEEIILWKSYKETPNEYLKYDNYDAIEVSKVKYIPFDYDGTMGVPISFVDKYNPKQFKIINRIRWIAGDPIINGKAKYARIAIQRIQND